MSFETDPSHLEAPDDLLARRTAEYRRDVEAALGMTDDGESAEVGDGTEVRTVSEILGWSNDNNAEVVELPIKSTPEQD